MYNNNDSIDADYEIFHGAKYPKQFCSGLSHCTISHESERKCEMSIIHGAICNDGIVLLSDSRSSKQISGQWVTDDNYEKIYVFKELGLVAVSSGLNEFFGNSFCDLCKQAESLYSISSGNKSECIDLLIDKLNRSLQFYVDQAKTDCQVIYGYYSPFDILGIDGMNPHLKSWAFSYNKEPFRNNCSNIGDRITFGVGWAQRFMMNYTTDCRLAENCKVAASKMMKKIVEFSNENEMPSFIGGEIRTVVIDKNGKFK